VNGLTGVFFFARFSATFRDGLDLRLAATARGAQEAVDGDKEPQQSQHAREPRHKANQLPIIALQHGVTVYTELKIFYFGILLMCETVVK